MKLSPSFTTMNGVPVLLPRNPNDTLMVLKMLMSIEKLEERPVGNILFKTEDSSEPVLLRGVCLEDIIISKSKKGETVEAVFKTDKIVTLVRAEDIQMLSFTSIPTDAPKFRDRTIKKLDAPVPAAPAARRKRKVVAL